MYNMRLTKKQFFCVHSAKEQNIAYYFFKKNTIIKNISMNQDFTIYKIK